MMWGVIPAAGAGSRIQPLAFSKELLPVGSRFDPDGTERPRAVSEFLVERMRRAGATRICFVISPGKSDIMSYYGARVGDASIAYVVQPRPAGLCDSIFCALPLIRPDDSVVIGLPDTIWFPDDALTALPDDALSLLLFPVERPQLFDAVVFDETGTVSEVQVKSPDASSPWIWGAVRCRGSHLVALHGLWQAREARDEYLGTLLNAFIAAGGRVQARCAGRSYVDVGTLHGYREAIALLSVCPDGDEPARPAPALATAAVTSEDRS